MTTSPLIGKGLHSSRKAARLPQVPAQTIRRWMFGHQNKDKIYPAIWITRKEA